MDIPCKYYFDLIFVDERPQATLTLDGKFFHGAGATATDAVNALVNDLRLGGYAASPSSDMSYITASFDKPNAVTRAAIRKARSSTKNQDSHMMAKGDLPPLYKKFLDKIFISSFFSAILSLK